MSSKRVREDKATTIKVTSATKDEVKKRKNSLGLRSAEDVIQDLLQTSLHRVAPDDAVAGSLGDDAEENVMQKNERLPQRMHHSELVKNAKAVRYYTGLHFGAYLWLQKTLSAEV